MRHIRTLALLFLASAVLLTSAFSFWQLFLLALDGRAVTKATQVESAGPASRLDAGTDLFFENEVDLGTIKETTTREVSFHNRSDTIIRILGVHASCNCAKVELSKSVLEPREEARITVRIEPRPDRLGRQRYSIDLDYLGESRRTARLELRADYRPDLVVPPQLSIRSVAGRGGTASFSITDFRTVPLEFTDIQPSCPELHVHIIEKPSA